MVKFQVGHSTYVGPGEWSEETERSAARQQQRRQLDDEHGPRLELLAQELAKRKDDLAHADEERALRTREVDLREQYHKDDIRLREADDARAAKDRADLIADRDRERASGAKAFTLAAGGGGDAPIGQDLDGNGTPDYLEVKAHDDETARLAPALEPLLKDMDPRDQERVYGVLDRERTKGRQKIRAAQVNAKAMKLAKAGMLDEAKMLDLQTQLDAGTDPEKVDRALDDLEEAHATELSDGLQKQNAVDEATQLWKTMQSLGIRLTPGARAEIATLAGRMSKPTTSGAQALKYADEIRKLAFKDAGGLGADEAKAPKPWHESDTVREMVKQGLTLKQAKQQMIEAGVIPDDDSGAATRPSGAGSELDAPPTADEIKLKRDLERQLGRPPTPEEFVAAQDGQEPAGSAPAAPAVPPPASKDLEAGAGRYRSLAETRAIDEAKGREQETEKEAAGKAMSSAADREFLRSALGEIPKPKTAAEKKDYLDQLDDLIEQSSGGYREKAQRARAIVEAMQVP